MRGVFAALLILLASARCGSSAHAQQHDDALDLARLCVHESGWNHPAEAAAIYAVAVDGSSRTGMTWPRWLRVHSRRFATHRVARSWVYALDRSGRDPHAGIAWTEHRERWLTILAAADAAIGAPPVCVARTWGSADDARRVARLGLALVPVACGSTRNIFFARRPR